MRRPPLPPPPSTREGPDVSSVTGVSAADELPARTAGSPCRATAPPRDGRRPALRRGRHALGSSSSSSPSSRSSSSSRPSRPWWTTTANFFTSPGVGPRRRTARLRHPRVPLDDRDRLDASPCSSPCPVGVGVALFITQYAPPLAARPGRGPRRPARRGPVDRLRPLGPDHLRPVLQAGPGAGSRTPRLVPALRPDRHHRRHDLLHRHRPRDHGPAHRHGPLARGLRPDADSRTRRARSPSARPSGR